MMEKFMRFMTGRYGLYSRGFDTLSKWVFFIALGLNVISWFVPWNTVRIIIGTVSVGLFAWDIYRFFSRNIAARQNENMRFIRLLDNIVLTFGGKTEGDRMIYRCPKCRTKVRVPKGKGKIKITCPKCKKEFVRKT